ncbi:MAG: amidohydrolase [Nocardioides sp.]|uniref:amidohydrolase n=1 Tax=Nocardioides sp. TaxID=35761 RepID=UPI0039E401B2
MSTTLFANGPVFDGRHYLLGVGGVLVRDGVIEAVLSADDPLPGPGEVDEIVDQAGGLLTPGFTDAHVHAVQGGLERIRCDLSQLYSRDDYLATVKAYADAHPDLPWIVGGGWAMACFPGGAPLAADLDAVVPDRPVFLVNRDHHGAWANTRAFEVAGVTAATPDPPDGYLERDADGAPTGTLHEGAMALVADHLPETTDEELMAGLLEAQAYLHSVGVTGWQDAIVGAYAGMTDPGPTYAAATRDGLLTADVVGALWWDRDRGVEQIPDLVALRASYDSQAGGQPGSARPGFRATSVKVMQDGVPENGTASMSTPYLDRCHGHLTANSGHSFVDPAVLREAAPLLTAEGFQIHIHAIGDGAVTESLDALEAAIEAYPGADRRHHVAHLQFVRPEDQPRFGASGVAVNMQTLWACHDDQMVDLVIPQVGTERAAWQYPWATMLAAGARLVAGSDWPVSTPDPWQALHVAVNRTDPGRGGDINPDPLNPDPLNPEQAIPLEAALTAYTSGSAWVNHRDDAGLIAPGMTADLVVHDRDPFATEPDGIADVTVVSTWVGGVKVYDSTEK